MALGNTLKKQTKTKSSVCAEISAKMVFIPFESLQAKTREKLSSIHSLVVAMVPAMASKRGFEGEFVFITTKGEKCPAMLVLDKHVKESVAVVSRGAFLCEELSEGDDITVTSGCPYLFAEEVSFSFVSTSVDGSPAFTHFLKEQLVYSGLVISSGMKVVIQYLSQEITLKVTGFKIFGMDAEVPFQCIPQTCMNVEKSEAETTAPHHEVQFKDIGGYEKHLESLCQQIDCLLSDEKIKPSKGVLISGPSGCGKTLIGKALKAKYGKKFMNVPLEEVKTRYPGEAEQNLNQYFLEATRRAPCLLFMDDIDAVCGSRDKSGSSSTGIVTALLHLLDGTNGGADDIMVIATAISPELLDAALRRPGRLSYDVCLRPPSPTSRGSILHNLLSGIPSNISEGDVSTLAEMTHGYVGGDLRSVVVEALMQAGDTPLTRQHLEAALTHIRPAMVRDSSTANSGVKLSDICGYVTLKRKLHEAVSLTLKHSAVFKSCRFSPPSRFLLFGPPGCGKSTVVRALATEFHLHVIPVKRSTVLGKYFGESEQNLAKIFQQANKSSPCIIHFENFEGLAGMRKHKEGGGADAESRVVNHLKVKLDGIVQNDGTFVFAETNRPDLLNKDVIRPGRFHEYHLVDLPTVEDRCCILEDHLMPFAVTEDVSLDALVTQTEHFTVAEILQFCEEVRLISGGAGDQDSPTVTSSVVEEALEATVPNTSQKMLRKYQNFAKFYCANS